MRIQLAIEPVDFRKSIDGLAALCRQALQSDPLNGTLFVFCGRSRQALKCLMYDGYVNFRIMGSSLGHTSTLRAKTVSFEDSGSHYYFVTQPG